MYQGAIPGKELSARIAEENRNMATKLLNDYPVQPKFVILMISDDKPSDGWIIKKQGQAKKLGFGTEIVRFEPKANLHEVLTKITELNADNQVTGILVQLPLYSHLEPYRSQIISAVAPEKDVDGLGAINQGLLTHRSPNLISATVLAIMEAISYAWQGESWQYGDWPDLSGKKVTIINDSILIGRPLAMCLLDQQATVSICHAATPNLQEFTANSDIVVSATGQVGLLTAQHFQTDAVIIDVTSIKTAQGWKGDVVFDSATTEAARAWTPVPGGVGPLTIACLMSNLLKATEQQLAN